jgi:thymidine kinase
MNMRIDENGAPVSEGEQVLIGGNNSYVSTCRLHFKSKESGVNAHFKNYCSINIPI